MSRTRTQGVRDTGAWPRAPPLPGASPQGALEALLESPVPVPSVGAGELGSAEVVHTPAW